MSELKPASECTADELFLVIGEAGECYRSVRQHKKHAVEMILERRGHIERLKHEVFLIPRSENGAWPGSSSETRKGKTLDILCLGGIVRPLDWGRYVWEFFEVRAKYLTTVLR